MLHTNDNICIQAISVLGLLGALDPYKYKEIQVGGKETKARAAFSEPINTETNNNEATGE